jgi:hypothetical protein
MTVSTLRPNSTVSNTGTLVGAATVHAALSDDSDSSYVGLGLGDFLDLFQVHFGDLPALPAGAVIKSVGMRVRSNVVFPVGKTFTAQQDNFGPLYAQSDYVITWSAITTITGPTLTQAGITKAQVDAVIGMCRTIDGGGDVHRVYEVYLDVVYVTVPVADPTAPTGTLTTENTPLIRWANTIDNDGGALTNFQVRVFTDAQYGAGGFDPGVSAATVDSGVLPGGGAGLWDMAPAALTNDTYRAYVRVAQTVNGVQHWSAWDFTEFTIDVTPPQAPALIVTADNANARHQLTIDESSTPGAVANHYFEIERSLDAGATWGPVRQLAAGRMPNGAVVVATGEYGPAQSDSTVHNVPLPTPLGGILAGDLLIAFLASDGNPTIGFPVGWTEIKDEAGNGSAVRVACAWNRAAGGETGTIDVTNSVAEMTAVRILCIRYAHPTSAPEISAGQNGIAANSGNPDSLTLAGWGVENTLWIAAMGNDDNVAVTAGPADYGGFGNTRMAAASGAGVATAYRHARATSQNPGTFTHATASNRAWTVAVRPAQATPDVFDYEAPNGVATAYRLRSLLVFETGSTIVSAWTEDEATWTSTSWWLKHPHRPDLNMIVLVRSFQSVQRAGRQGVFQALGATDAIVVSDTPGPWSADITFRLDSLAEQAAFDALFETNGTLLLQSPPGEGGPDYVRFGDQTRQRVVDRASAAQVFDAVRFTAVASPTGDVDAWP